jgi:3-oxoacyl-[acyl-carrier protein] reductase
MAKLSGKVAVVTGASKGIGAAIAKSLAAEGARVVVNYSSSKKEADQVVQTITQAGGEAVAVKANLAQHDDAKVLLDETKKRFGKLDILVNNAGVYEFRPLDTIDEEHLRRQFDVNVFGLLYATQEAAKLMADGGSVINISSIVAMTPPPGSSAYSATKAAVEAISRVLAQELGARKIRVNSLAPGFTLTEGVKSTGMEEELRDGAISRTPLGRAGEPDDIAKAAVFLASEESGWITGETIRVGGGIRL